MNTACTLVNSGRLWIAEYTHKEDEPKDTEGDLITSLREDDTIIARLAEE